MAKTKSKSPAKPAPAAPANLDAEVAKKFVELKTEGNQAFARGDYAKALNVYDDAIKLLPTAAPERADIYNNKAACFIGQKRYKEAVKECSSALEVAPNSVRALQRRAKAFEQQGLFKEALADVTAINKTDLASPETQEQERRLREAAARGGAAGAAAARPRSAVAPGARGAGAAGGAGAAAAAAQNNKLQNLLQQGVFVAKASLGDDTKLVHLSLSNSYADVLAAVQQKFPSAGPFLLKYVDKNGDLITLTCKADMHVALGELVQQYQRQVQGQGAHGPKLTAFPPLKLTVQPCAEADVPKPPVEEELERAQMMAMQRAQLAAAQAKVAEASGAGEEAAHMDSWIMDFAQLFVQQTGLEPDKHIDLHNMGWEAVTKALDNTLHAEAAAPLFAKARDSFRDVAATGLTGWGQVHQLQGNRLLEAAGRAGQKLEEVKSAVEAEFAEAEKRFTEALSYSPEFFDAAANMCQLVFERAKLAAGLMPTPEPEKKAEGEANGKDGGKSQEQVAAEQAEAAAAATKAALANLTAAGVEGAKGLYASAMSWADKAVALAPKHDEAQAARAAEGGAAAAGTNPGEFSFKAQALVLKGNFMYEWSQMLAAVGRAEAEWRGELDAAQALFREAGCPEKDIRTALRNHLKAPELNIPAEEEEPAAKEEPAKAAAKEEPVEEKPKAKGLPSLEVKKAKK